MMMPIKEYLDHLRHIGWLFKQMIKHFFKGDIDGVIDAYYWIKIHLKYDNKRIK